MPTSMKALPASVNTMNFIAAYARFSWPHSQITNAMGMSMNSQKKKNRRRSVARERPA